MSHHVEVFMDDDKTWGWQCFERGCAVEKAGLTTFHAAEVAANLHADSKSGWPREPSEGVAADNLQQQLDELEPRYLETLDADERGGR